MNSKTNCQADFLFIVLNIWLIDYFNVNKLINKILILCLYLNTDKLKK